jgi:hypothetical protein
MFDHYFAVDRIQRNMDLRGANRVVLWTHLGLGDQISAARILESYLDSGTQVFWPVKKRNLSFMNSAFGSLEGLELIEIDDSPEYERSVVKGISKSSRAKIVMAGHRVLNPLRQSFPHLPFNSLFNISVGMSPSDLVAPNLRVRLSSQEQCLVPGVPFAFVDHHPGTPREIPAGVLASIESRGLLVVHNPRGTELSGIMPLLDEAEELHLVGSAPLCLALTIDARAKSRTHYDSMGDPIPAAYARWGSVKIFGSEFPMVSAHEVQARNRFRRRVEGLVAASGSLNRGLNPFDVQNFIGRDA